ncbi:MAG: hypothetical protein M3680_30240 [Myxococcota bacterium]|nr:hypothetical protein [Myxococcota bacterium]
MRRETQELVGSRAGGLQSPASAPSAQRRRARRSAPVDVGATDRGTFAGTGSASLFSLLHASGACGGELSCARQATA